MKKNYFARYASPNIVIVPTSTTNTTTIAANSGPSTNKQIGAKYPGVLSKKLKSSHDDLNMSTNCRDIDSVEEALRQLHNEQTVPAVLSSKHEGTFISNSKYSCQSNLIELTNTYNNDSTLKSEACLKKQAIGTKVSKCYNIEANKEQDFENSNRLQNNTDSSKYSNNYTSSTTSVRANNKLKHMNIQDQKRHSQSTINQTETKDSPCESSRKRSRKQEDCNDKNVNMTCLEQRKVLKMKASSSSNNHDKKHFELSLKDKLTLPSKEQRHEYENIKSNNDGLRSARILHEQINVKTSGALKRYLDYRRFLDNCYKKRDKKSCLTEPKVREERSSKYIKEKEASRNVKPVMERKENKENLKLKSVIERAKKKQESKKINSYIDKKISHKESTTNEHTKYKNDNKDITSTERIKKKDEIKIKLTSYLASKKKKEKPDKRHDKHSKTVETNKKLNFINKKEILRVKKQRKSQKELCNGTSYSERKKLKDETNKKTNQIKTSGPKRQKDFEHEKTQKSRKSESSTERNSSCRKITEMTPTSTRTVKIIKEPSGINLPSINTIDLRSKLTRKRTINQSNIDITRIKSSSKRENLLVTLNQEVQARRFESSQAASKPKVKKTKKIKLVINIKCPNSNDDSDEVANESEPEITSGNTSPHQDLSFLDEIDIDGIVDSLNAGQRMESPIRENNISTEVGLNDELICKNNSNSSVEALTRDCHLIDIQHPDSLIHNSEQSNVGFINKVTNPQVIATKNNTNLLKGYNDDVYEVIDITDDVENNTILVDDDSVLVSMDQNKNVKQSIVLHKERGNKSDIFLSESNKANPKVPIIYINNNPRDGTGAEINIGELLDVKHWDAQVNGINANQETSNNLSKDLKVPKKENECREVSEIVVASDFILNDTDHPPIHIKKESDIHSLLNIKNETYDNNIVPSTSVKKEVSHNPTRVKKEPHDETISSTKIINSENVSVTLPVQSNIDSKDNDKTPAKEVSVQNTTIIKSENTNSAFSEYDSHSKKDSINPTVDVNQSKYTPFIEKVNTELSKNKTKQAEIVTSTIKNRQDNPVTLTDSPLKIPSIPKESELKIGNDINNATATPQTNLENKHVEAVESPSINTEHYNIGGNLNKGYINAMEKQMFESLHKKFTVLDLIHGGYFSNIYKCQDSSGGLYAVKVLRHRFLSMGMYKKSIFTGLQKIRNKYGHFNIEIISHFYMGWELCWLTEYYPRNLGQELANKTFLNIDVVQNLSRQLVSAVIMLTRNCIIHSDIKPSHILLNSEGNGLKLCGFDRADYGYNIKITPSSGTSSYRAPEIILGFKADYKIDVWATALVIYEMASGTKLFPGIYNNQILYHQICTLGPIDIEMLERSTQVHKHFLDTNFMRQVGPKVRYAV
ncbi:unnamed protein product [Arctia plantaginis]|uniref:Protein kinase domain-containing protein n=1 Tax=Arctia plantaginis TaxID=874455 RepID=A0A8S1AU09_ARCPL|nr:unnamed protein product [Arctia plantaginis]